MSVFVIADGKNRLRVREEDFGCVITDGKKYAEGNITTYYILKALDITGNLNEAIDMVVEYGAADRRRVIIDMCGFFDTIANGMGWLEGYLEQINQLREGL